METKTEKIDFQKKLEERKVHIEEDIRGCYFRDQTKIIHSLAFRRLKDKTQVVSDPTDDHVCTRVEHVLHVATVAKSICRGLNKRKESGFDLDEDLAFAIGLGHDLGHAPFGHAGEKAICKILGAEDAFMHELNGYRVVEQLECLNLTYAVKDGIICHNGEKFEKCINPRGESEFDDLSLYSDRSHYPITFEGCIVRFSDKIAYLGRDIEDAIRVGVIKMDQLSDKIKKKCSLSNKDIISYCVDDVINNSSKEKGICFSQECHEFMDELRKFNYENIYEDNRLEIYQRQCDKILALLYDRLEDSYGKYKWDIGAYVDDREYVLDRIFLQYLKDMKPIYDKLKRDMEYLDTRVMKKIIVDFIAGMTDRFALRCVKNLIIPKEI